MTTRLRCAVLGLLGVALFAGLPSTSDAAPIHYGDFGPDHPPGVMIYQDVQESSGTDPVPPGRFGAPEISGDVLDFDPTGFVASATGGGSDITDVQLDLGLMVLEVQDVVAGGLTSLLISESGDYTLFGAGTGLTSVAAGLSVRVEILEVDGVAITPISVFANTSTSQTLVSSGPVVLAPWSSVLFVDFGPSLTGNDIAYEFGVTKAKLTFDDQLIAISEAGSVAFIAKKDFRLGPFIEFNRGFDVPEPSAGLLVLAGLGLVRRRRGGSPAR